MRLAVNSHLDAAAPDGVGLLAFDQPNLGLHL
jgi:hypothetical protein